MNGGEEFAEEYSRRERIRIVVFGIIAGAALVAAGKIWFFPWLHAFSATAACRTVLGLSVAAVLSYGLFAGLPMSVAFVIGLSFGRRGLRILKEGRVPPSGEKVFRPTRIKRGARAKQAGLLQILAVVPPFALALWGLFQAEDMVGSAPSAPLNCAVLTVDHH